MISSDEIDYVELQHASDGMANPQRMRVWQLPSRAKHRALLGEIFVGGVWGSVAKWFIVGGDPSSLVVSNGFKRLRAKSGCEDYVIDMVGGLVTETYRIQARALCTGSDGLAELSAIGIRDIILPKISDPTARESIQNLVEALKNRRASISNLVRGLQTAGRTHPEPRDIRGSAFVQV